MLTVIDQNGAYFVNIVNGISENYITNMITNIPSPLIINGNWELILESEDFQKVEKKLKYLI